MNLSVTQCKERLTGRAKSHVTDGMSRADIRKMLSYGSTSGYEGYFRFGVAAVAEMRHLVDFSFPARPHISFASGHCFRHTKRREMV